MIRIRSWLRRWPVGDPERLPVVKTDADYSEAMPADPQLFRDQLARDTPEPTLTAGERDRVFANVMRELDCICPCHERHDADLVNTPAFTS